MMTTHVAPHLLSLEEKIKTKIQKHNKTEKTKIDVAPPLSFSPREKTSYLAEENVEVLNAELIKNQLDCYFIDLSLNNDLPEGKTQGKTLAAYIDSKIERNNSNNHEQINAAYIKIKTALFYRNIKTKELSRITDNKFIKIFDPNNVVSSNQGSFRCLTSEELNSLRVNTTHDHFASQSPEQGLQSSETPARLRALHADLEKYSKQVQLLSLRNENSYGENEHKHQVVEQKEEVGIRQLDAAIQTYKKQIQTSIDYYKNVDALIAEHNRYFPRSRIEPSIHIEEGEEILDAEKTLEPLKYAVVYTSMHAQTCMQELKKNNTLRNDGRVYIRTLPNSGSKNNLFYYSAAAPIHPIKLELTAKELAQFDAEVGKYYSNKALLKDFPLELPTSILAETLAKTGQFEYLHVEDRQPSRIEKGIDYFFATTPEDEAKSRLAIVAALEQAVILKKQQQETEQQLEDLQEKRRRLIEQEEEKAPEIIESSLDEELSVLRKILEQDKVKDEKWYDNLDAHNKSLTETAIQRIAQAQVAIPSWEEKDIIQKLKLEVSLALRKEMRQEPDDLYKNDPNNKYLQKSIRRSVLKKLIREEAADLEDIKKIHSSIVTTLSENITAMLTAYKEPRISNWTAFLMAIGIVSQRLVQDKMNLVQYLEGKLKVALKDPQSLKLFTPAKQETSFSMRGTESYSYSEEKKLEVSKEEVVEEKNPAKVPEINAVIAVLKHGLQLNKEIKPDAPCAFFACFQRNRKSELEERLKKSIKEAQRLDELQQKYQIKVK